MKKLLTILLFFYVGLITAQTAEKQPITDTIGDEIYKDYSLLSVKPEFPGGLQAFYKFIGTNFRIPDVEDLNGKIIVTFVIEKDGTLNNISILKDIGHGTEKEALRTFGLSPKWHPAKIGSQPVRVEYTLPITINTRG
jgi:protein TonB